MRSSEAGGYVTMNIIQMKLFINKRTAAAAAFVFVIIYFIKFHSSSTSKEERDENVVPLITDKVSIDSRQATGL